MGKEKDWINLLRMNDAYDIICPYEKGRTGE